MHSNGYLVDDSDPAGNRATVLEGFLSRVARLYPLVSGCGLIANSALLQRLSPRRRADLWARVADGKALVPVDDYVGRAMFFFGDLDPKVTWALGQHLRPGDVALDVGANLGLVSIHMARMVGGSGQVHAFEPNPRMLAYLRKTLAANPDMPIRLHPFGLGAAENSAELMIPEGNEGAASLINISGAAVKQRVSVPIRRLDDLCAEAGIDRVAAIKMDVEGFEAEVLRGAEDTVARLRPRAILLEEWRYRPDDRLPETFSILQRLGYAMYAMPRNILRPSLVPLDRLNGRAAHDFVALPRGLP